MVSVRVQNMGRWSDIWQVKIPEVMAETLSLVKMWSIIVCEVGVMRVINLLLKQRHYFAKFVDNRQEENVCYHRLDQY